MTPQTQPAAQPTIYEIHFEVSVGHHRRTRAFKSAYAGWTNVSTAFRDAGNMQTIRLVGQFGDRTIMPDEVAGHRNEQGEVRFYHEPCLNPRLLPRPGGTVILLESPHVHEYDENFNPIGPLKGPSRVHFEAKLETVFNELARYGTIVPEGDIVLCNPVPYQASLARVLTSTSLDNKIRDMTWNELFSVDIVHDYFISRLRAYSPRLVLICCTEVVGGRVVELLNLLKCDGQISCELATAYHPGAWFQNGLMESVRSLASQSHS